MGLAGLRGGRGLRKRRGRAVSAATVWPIARPPGPYPCHARASNLAALKPTLFVYLAKRFRKPAQKRSREAFRRTVRRAAAPSFFKAAGESAWIRLRPRAMEAGERVL